MESVDIRNLREWSPQTDVFHKIPLKIQKGFFFQELNVTCVDALPDFVALGTDAGIIYWYNRQNGDVQKLRTESSLAITCIKIISSVEYMIAVGHVSGEVSMFQIQKELPPDLIPLEMAASLIQSKPIERYTIGGEHRGRITCVEWSKNGMKLFSGDANGVVILTEFDFIEHISKSMEIINEAYDIVQLCFSSPWLIVSTVYRTIICVKDTVRSGTSSDDKWKVSQIGKADRKVLNNFGAVFTGTNNRKPSIVCSRPGFRFWLADTDANVSHTFLLKDSVLRATYEVPLLNPVHNKQIEMKQTHFGPCFNYYGGLIVTYCESIIFIINLEQLKVVATVKRLRKIQYLSINQTEIFILEGGRSLIRLAPTPETLNHLNSRNFVSNGSTSSLHHKLVNELPIEYEIEEETVTDADECIELPPIEYIQLDTPLECKLNEHNLLREDKLLLEHSRKLEVFEKINFLDYDDSILFNTGAKKKKKQFTNKIDGVVEIGRQAVTINADHDNKLPNKLELNSGRCSNYNNTDKNSTNNDDEGERAAKPCYLQTSVCRVLSISPDLRSPATIAKELIPKEEQLAQMLDIKPIPCQVATKQSPHSTFNLPSTPLQPLKFTYPLYYSLLDTIENGNHELKSKSPLHKIHQINDIDDERASSNTSAVSNTKINNLNGKCDDSHDVLDDLPKVCKMPTFMKIPNLWDVKIEKCDDSQRSSNDDVDGNGTKESSGSGSSEWEFL